MGGQFLKAFFDNRISLKIDSDWQRHWTIFGLINGAFLGWQCWLAKSSAGI